MHTDYPVETPRTNKSTEGTRSIYQIGKEEIDRVRIQGLWEVSSSDDNDTLRLKESIHLHEKLI